MAVMPTQLLHGGFNLFEWRLLPADPVAGPTPPLGGRSEKTVHVIGAAGDFNGATVALYGTLSLADEDYNLLNSIPDTLDLTFTAQTTPRVVLPHVVRLKPLVTGTLGAAGVVVRLLVSSGTDRIY